MENLGEQRQSFESLGNRYPVEPDTSIERITIAGVENYWFTPKQVDGEEVVIYLHGGGFIYGSIKSHAAMVSQIAKAIRRRILFVEYSLAPENPFPAALEEITVVIRALLSTTDEFQYGLMGDSAGGNLAMSVAQYLKGKNVHSPLYQIVISPWVNLDTKYHSYAQHKTMDPILTKEFMSYAASLYVGSKDIDNSLISPVHGRFEGCAPTLVLVGAHEILRDDSLHLYTALQNAGNTTYLKIYNNANHVWMLANIESQETYEAFASMNDFLSSIAVRHEGYRKDAGAQSAQRMH